MADLSYRLDRETVSSQALQIPHILSAIFYLIKQDKRGASPNPTLIACSLVNAFWREEANRIIWEQCGDHRDNGYRPKFQDLFRIEETQRQKYANYIRSLSIIWQDYFAIKGHTDSAILSELNQLLYPRLETFRFWPPELCCRYRSMPVDHFIQPKLTSLTLYGSQRNDFTISREFLQLIQEGSPGLKKLTVLEHPSTLLGMELRMSPELVTSFLQTFESLDTITWDMEDTMSSASFRILGQLSQLKKIAIWPIEEEWMNDLSESAFPALMNLTCSISGPALKKFMPCLGSLEVLRASELNGSNSIWNVVCGARLDCLTWLKLSLNYDTILHGDEISSVAIRCPQLQKLYMRGHTRDQRITPLRIEEFSEDTIETLAKHLPELRELDILCLSEINSLIALGDCCPFLTVCRIGTRWH